MLKFGWDVVILAIAQTDETNNAEANKNFFINVSHRVWVNHNPYGNLFQFQTQIIPPFRFSQGFMVNIFTIKKGSVGRHINYTGITPTQNFKLEKSA